LPGQPDRDLPSGQRLAILVALLGLAALGWLYLHVVAADMAAMGDMTMAMPSKGPVDLALLLAMWWIMMIGMMLPSAAPMILTFATISRRRRERGQPYAPTALFVAGYVLAWGGFSVAATLAQWGLERAALLAPMSMATTSAWLGGLLFLAAGLYQLTPLKQACLRACRSPFDFALNHWRDGNAGALGMGIAHGLYCLGCCWVLMTLLFVGGVMNLLWVAALAAVVLVEKLLPLGAWTARIGGVLLIGWGAWLLVATAAGGSAFPAGGLNGKDGPGARRVDVLGPLIKARRRHVRRGQDGDFFRPLRHVGRSPAVHQHLRPLAAAGQRVGTASVIEGGLALLDLRVRLGGGSGWRRRVGLAEGAVAGRREQPGGQHRRRQDCAHCLPPCRNAAASAYPESSGEASEHSRRHQNQDALSTWLRSGRPAAKARQLSAMISNRRSSRYGPCPAMCGVSNTLGNAQSGCSFGSGSCS
jgi:predicted metal-binding membrane protein